MAGNGVTTKQDVIKEVQEMMGLVPEWVKHMPDEMVVGFWHIMRDLHLAETTIPNKYKELIGIAVAGATRCKYCQLFHVEAAKLFGATEAEIAEAAAMAAHTMGASTFLNAMGIDYDQFARETRQSIDYVKKHMAQQAKPGTKPQPRA